MKSLTLNTHDFTGGAARAAFRLHRGLQSAGVHTTMMVRAKSGSEPSVVAQSNSYAGRIRALCDGLPLHLYPNRQPHNFSPAIIPENIVSAVNQYNPDIVHLHWLSEGFVRLESIAKLNCPIVWTLHDSWPFTGGCHLPGECNRYQDSCGHCPVLGSSNEKDLSRRVWSRKKKAWAALNLTVVAPSSWMADCARKSSLLTECHIEIIPNGIDTDFFSPGCQRSEKEKIGFSPSRQLILFGGKNSLLDTNKGFDLLFSALQKLPEKVRCNSDVAIFGDRKNFPLPDSNMNIQNFGIIDDEMVLRSLYRAADVFVLPSRQENLPNVVLESMACATPCVAFDVGGVSDMVGHHETGYLCQPYDVEDLSAGIVYLLRGEEKDESQSRLCREKILHEFAMEKVVSQYLDLYRNVLQTAL